MKHALIITAVAVLFTAAASARIGETYDECVARYGALREKKGSLTNPQFIFEKDGITVGINFLSGKAGQLSYSKSGYFLDSGVQKLLDVNSGESKWRFDPAETQRQAVRTSIPSKNISYAKTEEHLRSTSYSRRVFTSLSSPQLTTRRRCHRTSSKGFDHEGPN
jgi:hypothetical protein